MREPVVDGLLRLLGTAEVALSILGGHMFHTGGHKPGFSRDQTRRGFRKRDAFSLADLSPKHFVESLLNLEGKTLRELADLAEGQIITQSLEDWLQSHA